MTGIIHLEKHNHTLFPLTLFFTVSLLGFLSLPPPHTITPPSQLLLLVFYSFLLLTLVSLSLYILFVDIFIFVTVSPLPHLLVPACLPSSLLQHFPLLPPSPFHSLSHFFHPFPLLLLFSLSEPLHHTYPCSSTPPPPP